MALLKELASCITIALFLAGCSRAHTVFSPASTVTPAITEGWKPTVKPAPRPRAVYGLRKWEGWV